MHHLSEMHARFLSTAFLRAGTSLYRPNAASFPFYYLLMFFTTDLAETNRWRPFSSHFNAKIKPALAFDPEQEFLRIRWQYF